MTAAKEELMNHDAVNPEETIEETRERSSELERVNQQLREQIDEHLHSLEAMRESEEKYRTLVNNLNVGIYRNTCGPESRFLQANPAFVRIFGYDSLEEFMEIAVSDLYQNPADRELLIDEIRHSGSVKIKELAMRKKDGTPIWTSLSAIAQFDENGEIRWIDGILDDITERKRIASELRKSEEKYRTLVNNLNVGIYRNTIGPRDRFLQANPAFVRIFGYDSLEEFMEIPVSDLYQNPADRKLLEDEIRRTGFVNVMELATRKKDGSPIWVSISAIAQFDENGDIKWIDGILEDITDRKKAEDEIRNKNELLCSVLRAATAYSIIGMDPDGIIKVFNEGAELMLGYGADDVIGKVSFEGIHDPVEISARAQEIGVDPGFEVFVSAARRGQTETREWTHIRKDGSRFTVSMSVTAMRSKNGALTGFIGIARDISGEKLLEQQLLQSQKLESLGFLAGGVAHDFNNILTPILGFTEMLMNGFSEDDPRYQRLHLVKQAAERAKELTRRLLAFSRKQVFEMKRASLGQIVHQFKNMLLRTIRENIHIEFRISDSASTVRADAGQIEQVLLNLAVNAQDAMPEGGVLTVEVMDIDLEESYAVGHPEIKPGGYVMLAVSDTGEGMDKTTQEHIFEPFFTTKEMGKGTGLGLSTVYGIVKQHGGSINVYSEKNRGSTFKVFIPREIEKEAASSHPAILKDVVAHGSETILVIEDDAMVRTLVSEMLKELGYCALLAENTEQCIILAKEYAGPINMLLTDVIMPGMNGKELFDLLRTIRPELKVLFMSGYTSDVIGHHGVLYEGLNFIQKPFSQHALSEKVRQALDTAGTE